jgi:plastocyanin
MRKLINPKSKLLLGIISIFILLTVSNSCTKKSDIPGLNEVFIQNMAFSPSTITVATGTTITWTNKDGVAHTVTSTTGLFDSGTINANGTYSHMFGTVGSFPYKCTIHPSMTGTIIVN